MKVCVIFNPAAGRRRAKRRLEKFRARWQSSVKFRPTEFAGHAVDLARAAAEEGFDVVAAAGGDGTAHDVANGLLRSGGDATFAVVPIGSANDYAHSVVRQFGESLLTDDASHAVDVGVVRSPDGRERFFIEGIGLGLVGQVTLESGRIAWLQGIPLYGLAAWRAISKCQVPPETELVWDGGEPERLPTLMASLLLGRREGNFLLAPDASLDDGLFDFVHAGPVGRWEAVRMLPRLARHGPPKDHPAVRLGRCRSLRLRSPIPLAVHTDGELFCWPEEDVREFEVELLPKRLRVKVCATC